MREKTTDGWFINIALELYDSYRKGYASNMPFAVESTTGTKPRTFIGFTRIMPSISIKNFFDLLVNLTYVSENMYWHIILTVSTVSISMS
jgi:hypothetical protein